MHTHAGSLTPSKAEGNGYVLQFDPSFLRRAEVRTRDGTHLLHEQKEPFHLPKGQTGPSPRHELVLEHPATGRQLRLVVDDPDHVLDRLVIGLKPAERCPKLEGTAHPGGEEVEIIDDTLTCPPYC